MRNVSLGWQRFVNSVGLMAVLISITLYLTKPWIPSSVIEGWHLRNDELPMLFANSAKPSEKTVSTAPEVHKQAPEQQGTSKLLDLNKATLAELDALPGIGPAKAQAILDYRVKVGQFRSIEELLKVKGIGVKIFESIKEITIVESK